MTQAVVSEHQPSMTEWLAAIGEAVQSDAFRAEDNTKAQRLEFLYQTIGLRYERPEIFTARDLADLSLRFEALLQKRGDELCALRLIPIKDGLPKIRHRGVSIREAYQWFQQQAIDPNDYEAHVCPHTGDLLWSAIFVVADDAIFGEIVRGLHNQLTHGDAKQPVIQFGSDFSSWEWSIIDPEARREVVAMLEMLCVADAAKRSVLEKELRAEFSHEYIKGYFEVTVWPGDLIHFIDYNRILPSMIPTPPPLTYATGSGAAQVISGRGAQPGLVRGRVVIIDPEKIAELDFADGDILVCENTDVRCLPLMRRAGAIVTDRGGILTHAAIISRELGTPCIVGTKLATKVLKDGDRIEVDATNGIVRKL